MKLHFFGAAREVTGSNILVETKEEKLLVDCGVFQGQKMIEDRNYDPFPFEAAQIKAVLLTHAHLDHCGRIPKLYHAGFRGKVYCTPPTRDLAAISLEDSVGLIAEEAEEHGMQPFFTQQDVDHIIPLIETVEYGQMVELNPNIKFRFQEAGHILGSASIELWADGEKAVFSGDLGNHPVPILRSPAKIDQSDIVVMESTYGHKLHDDMSSRRRALQEAVEYITKTNGVLMIPAFAIQRTQEILYELDYLAERKIIPNIPTYVDSPLAIKATEIFHKYPQDFNHTAKEYIKTGDDLFNFPGLTLTPDVEDSKKINSVEPPKIIIAGSGMLTGGRIRHHLIRYISDPRNMLLLVGYQVAGTLGRQLMDGAKHVRIFGDHHEVRAKVEVVNAFSAHADQKQLFDWFSSIKGVKKLYLNHGEEEQIEALAALFKREKGIQPIIPDNEQPISQPSAHSDHPHPSIHPPIHP